MAKTNPLLIAEIGHNWNGDVGLAKHLIEDAYVCGANIVKFQLYDVDKIKHPADQNYGELKRSQLTKDHMFEFYEHAKKYKIEFLVSIFDEERLKWTDEIELQRYKIASRTIFDDYLIRDILSRGKQTIISLGAWDKEGFPPYDADYLFCRSRRDILMHGMPELPDFTVGGYAGISDHCIGLDYMIQALDKGAWIFEKHLTRDKNSPGWDQPSSMTPGELAQFSYVLMTRGR
jgi:sialic acid synthase SpsE